MQTYLITFRSVTHAQRAAGVLGRGYLGRTPRSMEEQGCGYGLTLRTGEINGVIQTLNTAGIPFNRVYRKTETGEWRALS